MLPIASESNATLVGGLLIIFKRFFGAYTCNAARKGWFEMFSVLQHIPTAHTVLYGTIRLVTAVDHNMIPYSFCLGTMSGKFTGSFWGIALRRMAEENQSLSHNAIFCAV